MARLNPDAIRFDTDHFAIGIAAQAMPQGPDDRKAFKA